MTIKQLHDLNQYEIEVLRIANGEDIPGWSWGAAMSVCVETLKERGLVTYPIVEPTEKGKKLLCQLGY